MTHWRTPHEARLRRLKRARDISGAILLVCIATLLALLVYAVAARAQENDPPLHPQGCQQVEIDDGDGTGRFIDMRCCDPARVWSGDQGNRETAQVCIWHRVGEA